MINDDHATLVSELREIRKLLELLAEPAIAQRDSRLRAELRRIVGNSAKKQQSVLLMDGVRTQKDIVGATSVHQGDLSTMIGKLAGAGLLAGDKKFPKLALSIPANFFEGDD